MEILQHLLHCLYYEPHIPHSSNVTYDDIKLVFNKYNASYKLSNWNSQFETLKFGQTIESIKSTWFGN